MTFEEAVGTVLRREREHSQFSIEGMSQQLEISDARLTEIESGQRKIGLREFFKASRVLGISMDQIICRARIEQLRH